jgi:death-on-curing protein
VIRLSREQIVLLHEHLIAETGGTTGIRDEGLLDAAIQAPFMSFDQKELFLSIQQKAARLCYGLIMNHPFVDGNKRIGTHVMLVFLGLNGIELEYEQKELIDIIISIASSHSSFEELLKWILDHKK